MGPTAPETDVIIAQAMARAGASGSRRGPAAVILPPLTLHRGRLRPGVRRNPHPPPRDRHGDVVEIAAGLSTRDSACSPSPTRTSIRPTSPRGGAPWARPRRDGIHVAFPDVAAKPWALRLREEFRSGACHAGRFETSIVLAERPDLVRERNLARAFPANPASLSRAIRDGKTSFDTGRRGLAPTSAGPPGCHGGGGGRTLIDASWAASSNRRCRPNARRGTWGSHGERCRGGGASRW